MNRTFTCFASVVSEIRQSDIYLTVKARLLETPRANLNGVRVTAAFVDEIVDNEANYVGLPLCADVKNLANGDYEHLGHLYDARTGEFHSAQIGSFYRFEKEETKDGAALIGYARIMKRNKAVCHAISELFTDGALKFSFEISCGSYRELDDGTIEIDAAEDNFLEGAAVVSFPACENAVALDLVAECNQLADDTRKGENTMTDVQESSAVAEVAVEAEPVIAEVTEQVTEETEQIAETEQAETVEETAEAKEEAVAEATEEVAEVVVVEHHVNVDDVTAYDTDDGSRVEEHTVHETTVVTPIQTPTEAQTVIMPVENVASDLEPQPQTSFCVMEVAEDGQMDEDDKEDEIDENAACKEKKECAEEAQPDYLAMIAELKEKVDVLQKQIAEMQTPSEHVVAETLVSSVGNTMNPFVADVPMEKKYSLLEAESPKSSYTLLD